MKKYILFASSLLFLAACNKENAVTDTPQQTITLTATVNNSERDSATKVAPDSLTAIDGADVTFHWQSGDKILVASEASADAATQVFTLKEGSISEDGKTAQFTGTPLSDMSDYVTFYAGKNTDEATFKKQFDQQDSSIVLDNVTDNLNVMFKGTGKEDSLVLNSFYNTLRLKLTGNDILLGSLRYYAADNASGNPCTTIRFGTSALALSSNPTEVWVPVNAVNQKGFILRFYDKSGNLVMEKSTGKDISTYSGTLLFPVLVPVAKIGDVRFTTLSEAVSAANDSTEAATIELLTDCMLTKTDTIKNSVTLKLGTYTLTDACKGYAFCLKTADPAKTFTIIGKSKTECGHIVSNGTAGHNGLVSIEADSKTSTLEMNYVKVHGATEADVYASGSVLISDNSTNRADLIKLTEASIKCNQDLISGSEGRAYASIKVKGGDYFTTKRGFRFCGADDSESVIDSAAITIQGGVAVYAFSKTTLKNSTISMSSSSPNDAVACSGKYNNNSTLTVENTNISVETGSGSATPASAIAAESEGMVIVKSGTFENKNEDKYVIKVANSGGIIKLDGGTVKAQTTEQVTLYIDGGKEGKDTISVNGGEISGKAGVKASAGCDECIIINAGTFNDEFNLLEETNKCIRLADGNTAVFESKIKSTSAVTIPGGTFKKAVTNGDLFTGSTITGGKFYESVPYNGYITFDYGVEAHDSYWIVKEKEAVSGTTPDLGDWK